MKGFLVLYGMLEKPVTQGGGFLVFIRPYPDSQGASSQIKASVSTAAPIGIESIFQ